MNTTSTVSNSIMTPITLNILFCLSFLSPILGFILFLWLIRKQWHRIRHTWHINRIFMHALPALLLWLLCCLPFFYMIGLKSDWTYCRETYVPVNRTLLTRDNLATYSPKCARFDADALFEGLENMNQ